VELKVVNPYITCYICHGYLIDATTITECLHTFCKSCIVKYLEKNKICPQCEIVIHHSHPMNYISQDRTMQDIVLKLVPGLQEKEKNRVTEFYTKRNLPVPDKEQGTEEQKEETKPVENDGKGDCHRSDEQVNLVLECQSSCGLEELKRKFIRCSCHATITHLRKFVSKHIYGDMIRFKDVELLFNEEILGKDHTLKFITVTRWRHKDIPLTLNYRPKLEL